LPDSDRNTVHVAVGVLIRADGAVLLADRPAGKAYAGYWEFPGGKIEAGETVETALARELHEELGLDVASSLPWVVFEHDYPHAYVRLHFRRVFDWRGEPHARERQRVGFFLPHHTLPAPLLPAAVPAMRWLAFPPVYAMSNIGAMGVDAFLRALDCTLENGLRMMVVREPNLRDTEVANLVPALTARARKWNARILVSSRHGQSMWHQFDGVHLTARDLLRAERRPDVPLVAASAHDADELLYAGRLGCDFAILGPVKATPTHPQARTLDWSGFENIARDTPIPLYAIGGLRMEDLQTAQCAGAHGVALLRAAWNQAP